MHAISMANINKNDSVLDIGCGIGYQIPLISKKCRQFVGVDFSKEVIKICKKRYKLSNVRFVCADAKKLPFRKNSFDVVLLIDVLENLPNPILALKEARRIAKNNGKILISVPNLKSIYGIGKRIANKKIEKYGFFINNWYDEKTLKKLIKKTGLRMTDMRGSFLSSTFFYWNTLSPATS